MKPTHTSDPQADATRVAAILSALADGEADADEAGRGCQFWRHDAEARATWHAYQVIGDVMRSDELAVPAGHDASFMAALRERMKDEPVRVAPQPPVVRRGARERRWAAGGAVAAGFVALAGVAYLSLAQAPDSGGALTLASSGPTVAPQPVVARVAASAPSAVPTLVLDGNLIRDARLDAYFDAHRGAFDALPSAVPGGGLRSVDIILPQR